jgi:hypothetical protein
MSGAETDVLDPRFLQGERARLFAIAWTRATRAMADIRALPAPDDPQTECLRAMAGHLAPYSSVPVPILRTPEWASESVMEVLAVNAARIAEQSAYQAEQKRNSPVSKKVEMLLDRLGVVEYVEKECGLRLVRVPGEMRYTSYIFYDAPGSFLQWHLDARHIVDVSLLLCIDRRDDRDADEASATYAVTPTGVERFHFQPGQALIFDGAFTLHGRSPVAEGENVTILRIGFRLADAVAEV